MVKYEKNNSNINSLLHYFLLLREGIKQSIDTMQYTHLTFKKGK